MKIIIALVFSVMSCAVQAGVVIYGTRVIYPADKNEVMVQIMNQGSRSSLVQAWIDDGDTSQSPEDIDVPFLLTPPVSRLAANSGQQLKIKKMSNTLPGNKESLFFLNVLDIPPNAPENTDKNVIKFATQNRVKLFWRPTGIAPVNKASFQRLSLSKSHNGIVIKNDNANWITVTAAMNNNVKVNKDSMMLSPHSQQVLTQGVNNAGQLTLTIIDDYGNYISERITIK